MEAGQAFGEQTTLGALYTVTGEAQREIARSWYVHARAHAHVFATAIHPSRLCGRQLPIACGSAFVGRNAYVNERMWLSAAMCATMRINVWELLVFSLAPVPKDGQERARPRSSARIGVTCSFPVV